CWSRAASWPTSASKGRRSRRSTSDRRPGCRPRRPRRRGARESRAMLARRFDLIVFDWDGTLFASTRLIARCIQAACADLGAAVPSDRDASYVIGLGLADALRHAAPDVPSERYPELAARYRHHYLSREDEIVLFDGTLEMLRALKARNHWLGVATG